MKSTLLAFASLLALRSQLVSSAGETDPCDSLTAGETDPCNSLTAGETDPCESLTAHTALSIKAYTKGEMNNVMYARTIQDEMDNRVPDENFPNQTREANKKELETRGTNLRACQRKYNL